MRKPWVAVCATLGIAVLTTAALLWPKHQVQAQVGLPVGVADCVCSKATQLDAGASRIFVHVCQCGAQQCVISAGSAAGGSAAPQIAQSCR